MRPTYFASGADFRRWLEQHHARGEALWVGLEKAGSPRPGMRYPEAILEALCFGWIDGQRKSIDAERWMISFGPRKRGSIWSRINVAHVERLIAEGRMRPAGLAAFAARTPEKTAIYSFEQREPSRLDAARAKRLAADRRAHAFFETQPPGYRRTAAFWVMSAKQDATRDRRLEQLIASSARGELAPPFAYGAGSPAARAAKKERAAKKQPRSIKRP